MHPKQLSKGWLIRCAQFIERLEEVENTKPALLGAATHLACKIAVEIKEPLLMLNQHKERYAVSLEICGALKQGAAQILDVEIKRLVNRRISIARRKRNVGI